jgi:hypothetical protein
MTSLTTVFGLRQSALFVEIYAIGDSRFPILYKDQRLLSDFKLQLQTFYEDRLG